MGFTAPVLHGFNCRQYHPRFSQLRFDCGIDLLKARVLELAAAWFSFMNC